MLTVMAGPMGSKSEGRIVVLDSAVDEWATTLSVSEARGLAARLLQMSIDLDPGPHLTPAKAARERRGRSMA